jgi:glycosyltransferase involved in cell wall biosynthesis
MPAYDGCIRIGRLGDFPLRLDYFRNTDVLVANMPGIAQRIRDLGWTRGVEVISNFTLAGSSPQADRAQLDTPADAFVVVGVGRFVPRKGFHTLIEAMARVDGAYLWLVGEGEERANLEALAGRLGVAGRLRFVGWQADPGPFVAAADVFVMPSSHEPLGNVILEAWAIGTPVVASRSEGPQWMMQDGVDGLLFPIGDSAALSRAMDLLRADPRMRQTLASGGRRTLEARFSVAAITDAYLKVFSTPPRRR